MQAIHRVRRVDTKTACDALRRIIVDRLVPYLADSDHDKEADSARVWIEKAIVTYVQFTATDLSSIPTALIDMRDLLNEILASSNADLSPRATHAAQTLMWKASNTADAQTEEEWCNLLRHPIFENAGQINKARIGRYVRPVTAGSTYADLLQESHHISFGEGKFGRCSRSLLPNASRRERR